MSYVLLAAKRIFRKETDSIRTHPMVVGNFSNGPGTCCTNLHLISLRHATSRIFSCRHVWVLQIAKAKYRETIPEEIPIRSSFEEFAFYQHTHTQRVCFHNKIKIIKIYILFKNLYKYLVATFKRINRKIKEYK